VLIASMAQIAGSAWTGEFEQAWTNAFGIVAGATIEGAEWVQIEAAA
jgi:hemoglobin-like flavoprotein